jgi:hypothetical protein
MATAIRAEQLSFVIVGGTDAPGIMLVPDGKGGFKIVKVPGWNPEQMAELGSALSVVAAAARLKNPEVSRNVLNTVGKLVAEELTPTLQRSEQGHTVVIMAH